MSQNFYLEPSFYSMPKNRIHYGPFPLWSSHYGPPHSHYGPPGSSKQLLWLPRTGIHCHIQEVACWLLCMLIGSGSTLNQ